MKAPSLSKAEILKGLRNAHARFSEVENEARETRRIVAALDPKTPQWEVAHGKAFAANERLSNALWRLVGAVEFHIGVRR